MEGRSGRASGGQLEQKVDLTAETVTRLSQAQSLVATSPSNLNEALTLLAGHEKRCRIGNDAPSLVKVCELSLQLCKDCGDDERLVATLNSLVSKRNQKTKAISAMVQKAIPWVLRIESGTYLPMYVSNQDQKRIRDNLVVVLRNITDGKIFLEAERARLTRALAVIMEQDGDVAAAADILQDVHVETYGSLSKMEKIDFILEQMRLTLEKKDYVRASIVSNKINQKAIAEEGMEEKKIKYFLLMAEFHRHEMDAFQLAKDYYSIYCTSTVQSVEARWREALQDTVAFLALSPFSLEQQNMLKRINTDTNLEKVVVCRETVKCLLKSELISLPFAYQTDLESFQAFTKGDNDIQSFWRKSLRIRIIQHNIRVAAKYYRRIKGRRLAELLGIDAFELEMELSNMVNNRDVFAKVDRPSDIIRFAPSKTPEAILSDWSHDISTLLNLVETTTHLIHKETTTQ